MIVINLIITWTYSLIVFLFWFLCRQLIQSLCFFFFEFSEHIEGNRILLMFLLLLLMQMILIIVPVCEAPSEIIPTLLFLVLCSCNIPIWNRSRSWFHCFHRDLRSTAKMRYVLNTCESIISCCCWCSLLLWLVSSQDASSPNCLSTLVCLRLCKWFFCLTFIDNVGQ